MFTQNFVVLVCLELPEKFVVVVGGWWVVVEGNFSVLLWSKTGIMSLNSELDQAEQYNIYIIIDTSYWCQIGNLISWVLRSVSEGGGRGHLMENLLLDRIITLSNKPNLPMGKFLCTQRFKLISQYFFYWFVVFTNLITFM